MTNHFRWVRKAVIIVLGVMVLFASVTQVSERALTVTAFSIWLVMVVLLYRRFRRSSPEVPYACHAAAAMGLSLGVITVWPAWDIR